MLQVQDDRERREQRPGYREALQRIDKELKAVPGLPMREAATRAIERARREAGVDPHVLEALEQEAEIAAALRLSELIDI